MYHIELNYAVKDSPTDAQYKKLAELYKELSGKQAAGDELVIVPHREVDRGIKGAHDDPTNFDFNKFYDALKEQGVDVDKIKKITQERYSVPNRAEHKSNWPPVLEGPVEKEK